jgi:hypothetical protein
MLGDSLVVSAVAGSWPMGTYSSELMRQGGKTRAHHCAFFSSQTSDRALSATFKQSRQRLAGGSVHLGLEYVGR